MPIERRNTRTQTTALIVSVVILAIAVVLFILVLRAATQHNHDTVVNNNAAFDAGATKDLVTEIHKDGPLLFSDVAGAGQQRPIYVNHTGASDKTGWQVIDAHPTGAATDCFLKWKPSRDLYVTTCDSRTFPPDGGTQHHYTWRVNGGHLLVALNA